MMKHTKRATYNDPFKQNAMLAIATEFQEVLESTNEKRTNQIPFDLTLNNESTNAVLD